MLKTIFSVKNEGIRKVLTVFGIKIKFKSKKLIEKKKYAKLKKSIQNQASLIEKLQNRISVLEAGNKDNVKISQVPAITEVAMLKTKHCWDEIVTPKVKDNFETIEELKNSTKSIIRFGNGEFEMMEGINECFQKHDSALAERLKEIFKNEDDNLMIGIPQPYYEYPVTLNIDSKRFILNWFSKWHTVMEKYLNFDKMYYSTHISQVHPVFEDYDFERHFNGLKEIWNNRNITVITGDRVYNNIDYNIFENCKNIEYIYGPTTDAFDEYEALKDKISKTDKNNILVFSLGPTGKVIAYDMFKLGYRVLDLGHAIKDYDFYKKSKSLTKEEWQQKRNVFFAKD